MANTRETLVEGLADLVQRPDEGIDLPTAALVVARVGYPDLDIVRYRTTLRALVAEAVSKLGDTAVVNPADLAQVVFDDLGFRGNRDEYYDPRNSYLNDVLDRRLGIPISLISDRRGAGVRPRA
jgi:regulator of sirC expression with transglutaminase-like and TPR domain